MGFGMNPGGAGFNVPRDETEQARRTQDIERQIEQMLADGTLRALIDNFPATLAAQLAASLAAGIATASLNVSGGASIGGNFSLGGSFYNPTGKNTPVTVGYVAAYFNGPDSRLGATPSSVRYKQDIGPADTTDIVDAIYHFGLTRFRYIAAVEELGEDAPWELGPIAEYAAKTALREWVYTDEDGEPQGMTIERLTVPLIAVVQDLNARLQAVERRLNEIEGRA